MKFWTVAKSMVSISFTNLTRYDLQFSRIVVVSVFFHAEILVAIRVGIKSFPFLRSKRKEPKFVANNILFNN